MKSIMQGDAYSIPVRIKSGDVEITPEMVEAVEIVIGSIIKTYPNEISYADCWSFPLTQQETFQLMPSLQPMQIRVKFNSGDVVGFDCGCISINDSKSKVVL